MNETLELPEIFADPVITKNTNIFVISLNITFLS